MAKQRDNVKKTGRMLKNNQDTSLTRGLIYGEGGWKGGREEAGEGGREEAGEGGNKTAPAKSF